MSLRWRRLLRNSPRRRKTLEDPSSNAGGGDIHGADPRLEFHWFPDPGPLTGPRVPYPLPTPHV
eukprot:8579669-Pyramimonas_sp.AAC.1